MGLNVLSLFDGMGCLAIALKELGIKVDKYYASEIDKYAIGMQNYNFPETINLGDVRNVDGRKLGCIDIIAGGSPCFVAGTKVLTIDGYKNIENVKVGDLVLTHNNRYKPVVEIGNKVAETYSIKFQGTTEIVCTKEHRFYARKKNFKWHNDIRSRQLELGDAEWIEAEKIGNDYYAAINITKPCGEGLDISTEEAFVLGRYIADGHTRKDLRYDEHHNGSRAWQLILSIGNAKLEEFKSKIKTLKFSCYTHTNSVHRCVFSNKKLVQLAEENFGCGAENKTISNKIFNSSAEIKKAILEGYLSGDGSESNGVVSSCTISEKLALSLQRLIVDVEGVHANITKCERGNEWSIEGRIVNQKPLFIVNYRRGINGKAKVIDDKIWFGAKHFKKVGIGVVYNISVADDESYTANNIIVHNCTNFSFAGRRNGMNTTEGVEIYTLDHYLQLKREGFQFDGESFLFWEYMRILGEVRETNPNVIFFLENVEMGDKWENVITKAIGIKGIHINAALVSAQVRKRIYWTNIRTIKDGFFDDVIPDIPQPKDMGINVQDILEDEVDEKYYLKQEFVEKLLNPETKEEDAQAISFV